MKKQLGESDGILKSTGGENQGLEKDIEDKERRIVERDREIGTLKEQIRARA